MLVVEGLTHRFGGLIALDNVHFTVPEGKIVGLIGPNGAGKTTCFNIIAGNIRPTAGKILYRQQNITGKPPYVINNLGIARTFQVVKPFTGMTVAENILVAASVRHTQAKARSLVAEILDLTGLASLAHRSAEELSVGNLKKLEVARALATEPHLLLLDEPMGGLNPKEIDQMVDLLRLLKRRGITILIIEHIMKALMPLADYIVVLNYGKKIAEGTPVEIANNVEVINAYLGELEHVAS